MCNPPFYVIFWASSYSNLVVASKESLIFKDSFILMDFSLLSPLEFFADPKNGDGRNNKPPAMRVRVDCYTKKLPFRLQ